MIKTTEHRIRAAILARSWPFIAYILFLMAEGFLHGRSVMGIDWRWLYPVKISFVVAILLYFFRKYDELPPRLPSLAWSVLIAPLAGVAVFLIWIQLDHGVFQLGEAAGFDPRDPATGQIDWLLALPRLLGAALVVPVMEELFWRSFLMRWIDRHDFLSLAPRAISLRAILVTSAVFGLEHSLWFAGIIAGVVYALLYRVSGNLWTAVIAHAVTNGVLGLWVLHTGNWNFW